MHTPLPTLSADDAPPIDPRTLATRRRLTDALIELCERQRFELISITDLCREAGVARKTFYAHYDDLAALATDIVRELGLEIAAELSDDHLRVPHSASGIFPRVVNSLTARRKLVFLICRRFPPDAVQRGCLPVIESLFERTEALNGVQPDDPIARAFWCETIAASIATMFRLWKRGRFRDDPRVFADIGARYLGPGIDAYWRSLKPAGAR